MAKCEIGIEAAGQVSVDTFSGGWHHPFEIKQRILELFPNSRVAFLNEFPAQKQNFNILKDSLDCDELVFLTFSESLAYVGPERLTHRFVALVNACLDVLAGACPAIRLCPRKLPPTPQKHEGTLPNRSCQKGK